MEPSKHSIYSIDMGLLPVQEDVCDLLCCAKTYIKKAAGQEKALAASILSNTANSGIQRVLAQETSDLNNIFRESEFARDLLFQFHFACDGRTFGSFDSLEKAISTAIRTSNELLGEICSNNNTKMRIWKEKDMRFAAEAINTCIHILRVYAKSSSACEPMVLLHDAINTMGRAVALINQTSYQEQLQLFDKRALLNQDRINERMFKLNCAGIIIALLALVISFFSLVVQYNSSDSSDVTTDSVQTAERQVAESTSF